MKPNSKIALLKKQLKELASELDQARADKEASEARTASLQESLDEEQRTSKRLQDECNELKASQLNTGGPQQKSADADKIESLTRDVAVLRQIRTDLLKFLRDTFVVAPGEAADAFDDKSADAFDNSAEIAEDTKEQLWWCEWVRDHMRDAHNAVCWELRESRGVVYWLIAHLKWRESLNMQVADGVKIARRAELNAALEEIAALDGNIAALENDIAALEYHYARADAAVEQWQDRHVRYVQFVMETLRNENF
jgi:predicted RNase H-like nuclease (RuvC/YqgF family)